MHDVIFRRVACGVVCIHTAHCHALMLTLSHLTDNPSTQPISIVTASFTRCYKTSEVASVVFSFQFLARDILQTPRQPAFNFAFLLRDGRHLSLNWSVMSVNHRIRLSCIQWRTSNRQGRPPVASSMQGLQGEGRGAGAKSRNMKITTTVTSTNLAT